MQRGVQFEVFEDTAPSHKPAAPLLSKGVLLQGAENTHAKGGGKQSLVNKVSRGKSFGPKDGGTAARARADPYDDVEGYAEHARAEWQPPAAFAGFESAVHALREPYHFDGGFTLAPSMGRLELDAADLPDLGSHAGDAYAPFELDMSMEVQEAVDDE